MMRLFGSASNQFWFWYTENWYPGRAQPRTRSWQVLAAVAHMAMVAHMASDDLAFVTAYGAPTARAWGIRG